MSAPTLRELMRDPIYKAYIRTEPRLFENVRWGQPWVVMGRFTDDTDRTRWLSAKHEKYVDAFNQAIRIIKSGKVEDASIISRRQTFGPPDGFSIPRQRGVGWCGRCRRPVRFMYAATHPLLAKAPVITSDDCIRCPWCGMRRSAMPTYDW